MVRFHKHLWHGAVSPAEERFVAINHCGSGKTNGGRFFFTGGKGERAKRHVRREYSVSRPSNVRPGPSQENLTEGKSDQPATNDGEIEDDVDAAEASKIR
jgi:hypothetical protein